MPKKFKQNKKIKMNRTKSKQYKQMVEFIKAEPDMGQGVVRCPKHEVEKFWNKVSKELNEEGPPVRTADQWRKVWIDWKCYIKRKMTQCQDTDTMHQLTRLEEDVASIIEMEEEYRCNKNDTDTEHTQTPNQTISMDIEILTQSDYKNSISPEDDSVDFAAETMSSITLSTLSSSSLASLPSASCMKERVIADEEPEAEEVKSDEKLLQQELDIQKQMYVETKEFQKQTTTTLSDIAQSLANLEGSIKLMMAVSKRSLKEEMRHNRKTEELLEKLVASYAPARSEESNSK